MRLSRTTPCQVIEIWQPRWKDRKVLIAKFKVGTHNIIRFTKAKSLEGDFYLSGETIKGSPVGNNGKIDVYEVDLNELERLERV